MKKDILFKEVRLVWSLIIPFILIIFTLLLFMIIAIENEKHSLIYFFIFNSLLFATILLLFFKFKIELYKDILKLSFGIGIVSKKININAVDKNSISEKKIPWYYGIGWRYDLKGNILFNANFGKAVIFSLKDNNKNIMIVMKNRDDFKNQLKRIIE